MRPIRRSPLGYDERRGFFLGSIYSGCGNSNDVIQARAKSVGVNGEGHRLFTDRVAGVPKDNTGRIWRREKLKLKAEPDWLPAGGLVWSTKTRPLTESWPKKT